MTCHTEIIQCLDTYHLGAVSGAGLEVAEKIMFVKCSRPFMFSLVVQSFDLYGCSLFQVYMCAIAIRMFSFFLLASSISSALCGE